MKKRYSAVPQELRLKKSIRCTTCRQTILAGATAFKVIKPNGKTLGNYCKMSCMPGCP